MSAIDDVIGERKLVPSRISPRISPIWLDEKPSDTWRDVMNRLAIDV